mmetsp:Transcript_7326/g.21590  ORF Transcript_7326/g.21590 Transcript_7326/m.21590 type:complete len:412 (+) Transcript_7326:1272-2507(+)
MGASWGAAASAAATSRSGGALSDDASTTRRGMRGAAAAKKRGQKGRHSTAPGNRRSTTAITARHPLRSSRSPSWLWSSEPAARAAMGAAACSNSDSTSASSTGRYVLSRCPRCFSRSSTACSSPSRRRSGWAASPGASTTASHHCRPSPPRAGPHQASSTSLSFESDSSGTAVATPGGGTKAPWRGSRNSCSSGDSSAGGAAAKKLRMAARALPGAPRPPSRPVRLRSLGNSSLANTSASPERCSGNTASVASGAKGKEASWMRRLSLSASFISRSRYDVTYLTLNAFRQCRAARWTAGSISPSCRAAARLTARHRNRPFAPFKPPTTPSHSFRWARQACPPTCDASVTTAVPVSASITLPSSLLPPLPVPAPTFGWSPPPPSRPCTPGSATSASAASVSGTSSSAPSRSA